MFTKASRKPQTPGATVNQFALITDRIVPLFIDDFFINGRE
jgi:hypothetical protein